MFALFWFSAQITACCIWVTKPVDWVIKYTGIHWYTCCVDGWMGVQSCFIKISRVARLHIIGVSGYCLLSSVRANQNPAYFRLSEPLILFTNKSLTANEESVIQWHDNGG